MIYFRHVSRDYEMVLVSASPYSIMFRALTDHRAIAQQAVSFICLGLTDTYAKSNVWFF